MTSTAILLAAKDNASGQLSADISAASLSIVLQTGQGAIFPQPYSGSATSLGTSTTLNCTGILALIGSGSAKKFIRNVTDGSVAFIESVATNAVTTSPLLGGTTNVWNNSDEWRIDEFVITLEGISTSVYGVDTVTKREECLIKGRTTDTLTVASGGRGYNSSTAQTFSTNDYVRLLVTAPYHERMKDYLYELAEIIKTNTSNITTNTTAVANIRSGSDFYAVATGSSNAYAATYSNLPSIATGLTVDFKANFSISGPCTFNYNSGGAISIKRLDGATALATGDIVNGQIVTVRYDGTNWQMLSPSAASGGLTVLLKSVADGASAGASTTSEVDVAPTFQFDANTIADDDVIEIDIWGLYHLPATTFKLYLGATVLATFVNNTNFASADESFHISALMVFRTIGASGTMQFAAELEVREDGTGQSGSQNMMASNTTHTINTTINQILKFSITPASSNANHSLVVKQMIIKRLR